MLVIDPIIGIELNIAGAVFAFPHHTGVTSSASGKKETANAFLRY